MTNSNKILIVTFVFGALLVFGMVTTNAFTIHDVTGKKITVLAPQLITSGMSSSTIDDFSISTTSVQTVISGALSGTTSVRDVVENFYNSGSVLYSCSVVVSAFSTPPIFSAINPSIGTIDQSGNVTYITNGNAQFNVKVGNLTKATTCPLNETINQYSTTFNSLVPASLAQDMVNEMTPLINGLTPSSLTNTDLFSSIDDTNHLYTRNTGLFTGSIDLTSIPAFGLNGYTGVLVAPDIVIEAWHTQPYNGSPANTIYTNPWGSSELYFVDNSGNVYSSTIASEYNPSDSDIAVLRLTTPMPASITPAQVLASTTLPSKMSVAASQSRLIPLLVESQHRTLGIDALEYMPISVIGSGYYIFDASGGVQSNNLNTGFASSSSYFDPWMYQAIHGDSGHPLFAIINHKAVAIGVWTGSNAGYNIGSYISTIDEAMTAMGSSYQLTPVDISSFPTY